MIPLPLHQKLEVRQDLHLKIDSIRVMTDEEVAYLLAGLRNERKMKTIFFFIFFSQKMALLPCWEVSVLFCFPPVV